MLGVTRVTTTTCKSFSTANVNQAKGFANGLMHDAMELSYEANSNYEKMIILFNNIQKEYTKIHN